MMYSIGDTLYQFEARSLSLVKAAKRESPGQMSLFGGGEWTEEDEAKRKRDASGKFSSTGGGGGASKPESVAGLGVITEQKGTTKLSKVDPQKVLKSVRDYIKDVYRDDWGEDATHDWDKETRDKFNKVYQSKGSAGLGRYVLEEEIDQEGETGLYLNRNIARLALNDVDWSKVDNHVANALTGKKTKGENDDLTSQIATLLEDSIQDGLEEEAEEGNSPLLNRIKKTFEKSGSESVIRQMLNPASYSFDETLMNSLRQVAIEDNLLDVNALGGAIAKMMKL